MTKVGQAFVAQTGGEFQLELANGGGSFERNLTRLRCGMKQEHLILSAPNNSPEFTADVRRVAATIASLFPGEERIDQPFSYRLGHLDKQGQPLDWDFAHIVRESR